MISDYHGNSWAGDLADIKTPYRTHELTRSVAALHWGRGGRALASTRRGCRGHTPNILVGGTSTGIFPPILLRTFGYSRAILVALRSLSLKPISFGYKTPPIRFSQAGGQWAHKARPPQPSTRVDATGGAEAPHPNLAVLLTYCGQLILRKNSKFDATRCQILRLKCKTFDFLWGSTLDPAGGA